MIPGEAVEAAQLAYIALRAKPDYMMPHEYAQAMLEAAAPHLTKAAHDEGYRKACEDIIGLKPTGRPAPYEGRVPTEAEQAEIDAFQNGVYGAEPPEWWLSR